jgi:lysophospholipase L1-like esterase
MIGNAAGILVSALLLLAATAVAEAQEALTCRHFTSDVLASPEPREHWWPRKRFEKIKAAVQGQPYRVLFLGDSLTERFETSDAPQVWREHMAPRGVLDAGVSGDRTEHLLWRLHHGNLDGPPPPAVILLIGTNDLGHGRPPEQAAEGVRANLQALRQRLPAARILLLGLLPRETEPGAHLRREVVATNRLLRSCGNDASIVYADIGGALLEPNGTLPPEIAPDRLHFSAAGYARLAPQLDGLIDQLLAGR